MEKLDSDRNSNLIYSISSNIYNNEKNNFLCPIGLGSCATLCAQENDSSFIKNTFSVSLIAGSVRYGIGGTHYPRLHTGIRMDYGVLPWLETGVSCSRYALDIDGWRYSYKVDGKAHLLNIFWPSFSRFDVFTEAELGGFSVRLQYYDDAQAEMKYIGDTRFYYRLGIGAGVNFGKHFGLLYSYNHDSMFGNYSIFCLNFRFNGPEK